MTQDPPKVAGDCGTGGSQFYSRAVYSVTGTVTFTGNRYVAAETLQSTTYLTYSAACLASINEVQSTFTICGDIQNILNKSAKAGDPTWTCAGTIAAGCNCAISQSLPLNATGTVTVDGTKITFMGDTDSKPATPEDFCLKGNQLTVSSAKAVYVATKKP